MSDVVWALASGGLTVALVGLKTVNARLRGQLKRARERHEAVLLDNAMLRAQMADLVRDIEYSQDEEKALVGARKSARRDWSELLPWMPAGSLLR